MLQEYIPQLIKALSTIFPKRNEPNYAWGNLLSGYLLTPNLRGQWGVSLDGTVLYDHSGQGRTMRGYGDFGHPIAAEYGISPYIDFDRSDIQYFTRADEPGLDITDYLSLWSWVRFHNPSTGNGVALISKWVTAGNQRSYMLSKSNLNVLNFDISSNGQAAGVKNISDGGVDYVEDEWLFIAGRFSTSSEINLFVGNAVSGALHKYSSIVGVPAAIFNSTSPLQIASFELSSFFDGYMCFWGLCNYGLSDTDIFNKFHQGRPLYMW